MKIQVHEQINGTGKHEVWVNKGTGNPDKDNVTEDYKRNPSKYEMTEATATERKILREGIHPQQALTPADKARQLERQRKINEAQAAADVRRALRNKNLNLKATDFVESVQTGTPGTSGAATRRVQAFGNELLKRKFIASSDGTSAKRNDVPGAVVIYPNGTASHNGTTFNDVGDLRTYLDTNYPIAVESDARVIDKHFTESVRHIEASYYEGLGLTHNEAGEAARLEERLTAGLKKLGMSDAISEAAPHVDKDFSGASLLKLLKQPIRKNTY
jgi:hypothetical protein